MLCGTKEAALVSADILVVCTEWKPFWSPDFTHIKQTLNYPVIFDGRNLYDPKRLQEQGIQYFGIGRRNFTEDGDRLPISDISKTSSAKSTLETSTLEKAHY